MSDKKFKVFGDEELLNKCTINITKTDDSGEDINETLLKNGTIYPVIFADNASIYTVYLSYNDSLYASISYENILKGTEEEVHNFYLERKKEVIGVKLVSRKSNLKTYEGTIILFIPLQKYYEEHDITNEKDKKEIKHFFDNSYN